MADRISTRSASRRTTPQSPPKSTGSHGVPSQSPPQRAMRTTRSQSHNVSDSEISRTGAKGTRREASRQVSAEAKGKSGNSKKLKNLRTKAKPVSRGLQDLSIVNEDPSGLYPDLPSFAKNKANSTIGEHKAVQRPSIQAYKSPGGVSAFSGTTARTSRSAQELLGTHVEDLLDALPDLSSTSDKLLRLLIPIDPLDEVIGSMMHDLKIPDSRMSKNLQRLWNSFQIPREFYGNNHYIHIVPILRTLLGEDRMATISYGVWRPDPLLQKANLCSMLVPIVVSSPNLAGDQAIEELDHVFPIYFLNGFVGPELLKTHTGCSTLLEETLTLALELRTQYAIILLSRYVNQANFDPNTILSQVFYQATDSLKGWDMAGLRAGELPKAFEDMIIHRLTLIRESFLEEHEASRIGELADIESLKTKFPWDSFVTAVVSWSRARLDEIKHQIDISDGDGADNIKLALEQEIQSISKAISATDENSQRVQLDYDPPSELSQAPTESIDTFQNLGISENLSKGPGNGFNSSKALAFAASRLRERRGGRLIPHVAQEARMVAPTVHVAGTSPPAAHPLVASKRAKDLTFSSFTPAGTADEPVPQIDDDEGSPVQARSVDSERDYEARATQLLQRQVQNEAESNKENRAQGPYPDLHRISGQNQPRQLNTPRKRLLIDPQPGAVRVTFESQGSTQEGPSNTRGRQNNPSGSTVDDEQEEIENPTQDQGFQQDTRHIDESRRKLHPLPTRSVSQPVAAIPQAQKRARQSTNSQSPRKQLRGSQRATQVDDDEDDNIWGATEEEMHANAPPPSQLENYKKANLNAKFAKVGKQKRVQSRKPWTDLETEKLIALIEEHGISWALLKDCDGENGVLSYRDQVALKDKARNMKLDYLKAYVELPRNFDLIPLNKMQKDRLKGLGLNYDAEQGMIVEDSTNPAESSQE